MPVRTSGRAPGRRRAVPVAVLSLITVSWAVSVLLLWRLQDDEATFSRVFSLVALTSLVVSLAGFVTAWARSARGTPIRHAWLALVAAIALAALADTVLAIATGPGSPGPGADPSTLVILSDVIRGASVAAIIWGLLRLPEADGVVPPRLLISLDVLAVAVGGAAAIWFVTFGQVERQMGLVGAVGSVTPLFYVAAFFTAVARWRRGVHPRASLVVLLIAIGLLLTAGVNSYVVAVVGAGRPAPIMLPGLFVPATGGLIVTAAAGVVAALGWRGTGAGTRRPSTRVSLVAPVVGVLVVQVCLVVTLAREQDRVPWAGLVVASAATTCIVGLRQSLALRENRRLLHTDPLTGLANRAGLRDRLDAAVGGRGETRPAAVLVCDLDDFKGVNDAYGHDAGDRVLRHFASVVDGLRGPDDLAVRLGGDEFAVLMAPGSTEADAVLMARRIQEAAARPVRVGTAFARLRVSIGIAAVGDGGDAIDVEDLLRRADTAMYRAKSDRTEGWAVYDPAAVGDVTAGLADDLDVVLREGGLRLEFQPVVEIRPQATEGFRVRGVEALLRWDHPVRGTLNPLVFVPVAERAGLAAKLGEWVLEHAGRQVEAWRSLPGGRDLNLAVNMSPVHFDRADLVESVDRALATTGLEPERLIIEITEGALVDDLRSVPTLTALRSRGIRIALDDFGTGYSSLQYLTKLPVDALKLDKSFVADLTAGGAGRAVAEAVIRLAETLDLNAVAEGVEDEAQANLLATMGYRFAQGFLYAGPLTPEAVADLLTVPPDLSGLPGPRDSSGAPRDRVGRRFPGPPLT